MEIEMPVGLGMQLAMNSTAMMKAVTISGKMRRTHHTMAHTRMPIA